MNNIAKDILCQIIKTKKVKAFNEFSEIELGGKLVAESYNGKEFRIYNHSGKTHLMFPMGENAVTIQEGILADAIESGAIFDDANTVDAAATYAVGLQIARQTKTTVNMYNVFEIDVTDDDTILLTPLAMVKQYLKNDSKVKS